MSDARGEFRFEDVTLIVPCTDTESVWVVADDPGDQTGLTDELTMALRASRKDMIKETAAKAKESEERQAVPFDDMVATLPYLTPTMRALVKICWHSGARIEEALQITRATIRMVEAMANFSATSMRAGVPG